MDTIYGILIFCLIYVKEVKDEKLEVFWNKSEAKTERLKTL